MFDYNVKFMIEIYDNPTKIRFIKYKIFYGVLLESQFNLTCMLNYIENRNLCWYFLVMSAFLFFGALSRDKC